MSEQTAAEIAASDAHRGEARPRRSVAVLGGTGLIGSAVAHAFLDDGRAVTVLARRAPDQRHAPLLEGASVVLGDASDPASLRKALDGVDHVVAALGTPHPADSARAPLAQFEAEIPVLLGVLDEVRARSGVGLTYLSSGGAIYGDVDTLPVSEETECHPVSPYGVTKLAAERYVLMASRTDGVDVRILRVANAYGALQRPRTGQGIVAALLHAAATGAPVRVFGDGSAVRDYVEVRDVAGAVVALEALDEVPQVINVGAGTGHRLTDVLEIVEAVTGRSITVHHDAPRPSDVRAVVLDVTRLSSLVPWRPMPLEHGVADAWGAWVRWGLDGADGGAP